MTSDSNQWEEKPEQHERQEHRKAFKGPGQGQEPGRGRGQAFDGPVKTSGMAIASLVCAFFCQPAGLILGIIAMIKIGREPQRVGGMGLAIAGTVISAVNIVCVVPMVAIVAAIAIPGMLRSRIGANEASALGSLKAICTGQEQFKSSNCIDLNGNGVGEYGFLDELGGAAACRSDNAGTRKGQTFSASPYIPRILGTLDRRGISQKAGYNFIVYMPTSTESGSATTGAVHVPLSENTYIVYAWPQESGRSGVRIFAIDQQGQPYCIGQSPYSGLSNPPPWDFAFAKTKGESPWNSGIDESRWRPVG